MKNSLSFKVLILVFAIAHTQLKAQVLKEDIMVQKITNHLSQQPAYLDPEYIVDRFTDNFDRYGFSVAVDGDTLVVGIVGEDSNGTGIVLGGGSINNDALSSGAVLVYVHEKSGWTPQAFLKASNAEAGDQFGVSVDIDQDTIVVGARFEKSNASGVDGNQMDNSLTRAGAAYVFTRLNGVWSQQAYI